MTLLLEGAAVLTVICFVALLICLLVAGATLRDYDKLRRK